MRKPLFLLWVLSVSFVQLFSRDSTLKDILKELDGAIENSEQYVSKREARIEALNDQRERTPADQSALYELNFRFYEVYKPYKCDSAIAYLNRNIAIAQQLQDNERLTETKLLLASLHEQSGLYKEATDLIESIDRKALPERFIMKYYDIYAKIYLSLEEYTQDMRLAERYGLVAQSYRDSLFAVLDKNATDNESLIAHETFLLNERKHDEAIRINDLRLKAAQPGTAEYALVAYHRSLIEADRGDHEREKYNLALSALSDVYAAIKDHASLWMLAEILYKEGDIDRAYNYIRFSWNDTQIYNARHRNLQTAGIRSLIDQTYQKTIEDNNARLRNFTLLTSLLSFLLAIALFYIYRQMRKLSVARQELQHMNSQLQNLNEELKVINESLQASNADLSESNKIKEKYIGRFINLCSIYIDKLDAYRRMAYKMLQANQVEQLRKITSSVDSLDNELKELYTNFDTAFLQLFPDFVEKFNALLSDKEIITLKKGELLNTELRIYALIRLGIDDSAQIAEFLRYSLNTIYNYRAKARNKAKVSRDDFETLVKQIK
jgi:cell division protein FtsL